MRFRVASALLALVTALCAALFVGQAAFPQAGLYTSDGYAKAAFLLGSVMKPLLLARRALFGPGPARDGSRAGTPSGRPGGG